MRQLATIQEIKKLEPIAGADSIEKATVLGWECVVKKGDFKVGDLGVYCEVDSVLPERPEFEFLRPRKFRIKTIKLRGTVSQGIIFPLTVLPFKTLVLFEIGNLVIGNNVTEQLGVKKYEIPIPVNLQGLIKGPFPGFLMKSDEMRVQVLQSILEKYAGTKCFISEKVDGSSITFFAKDGEFGACSRNLELKENYENTIWKYAQDHGIKNKMLNHGKNIAIQGEILGPELQKNRLQFEEITVLFFNAFDIDTHRFFGFDEFRLLCTNLLVETVPILDEDFALISDIPKLVEMSKGTSIINPKIQREGIVIRSLEEKDKDGDLDNATGGRLSFKVVNPEYLLKYEE